MGHSAIRVRGDRFSCPNPLWTDSYTTCSYRCKFCFVKETEENFKRFPLAERTDFGLIEKVFKKAFSEKESKNSVVLALRHKLPLGIGSRCEPFQDEELLHEQTYNILLLAKEYDYPVIVNTKSARVCQKKYVKVLSEISNPTVIINLMASSELDASKLEPEASPQMYRWDSIKFLNGSGIRCDLRIAPLLPSVNDSEEQIEKALRKAKDLGVKHVAVEYYHLRYPEIANIHFEKVGFDFPQIYKAVTEKGYMEKKFKIFKEVSERLNLETSCPDWVEAPFLSDKEACCGTSDRYNFYKCTFQHAVKLIKQRGKLDWETFEKSLDFVFPHDLEEMKNLWRKKSSVRWSLWDIDDTLIRISEFDSEGLPIFVKAEKNYGLENW